MRIARRDACCSAGRMPPRSRSLRLNQPTSFGLRPATTTSMASRGEAAIRLLALAFAGALVAGVMLLSSVLAADVSIVARFAADKGPGYRKMSPDAAGAV